MSEIAPLFALTGPSGAGKGYFGNLIRRNFPDTLRDARVYTTRSKRQDEATTPNRVFVTDKIFHEKVEEGTVVLPHRPFRDDSTPLYGFERASLTDCNVPVLTEVHSSVVIPFSELVSNRPFFILGVMARRSTLQANLLARRGGYDGIPDSVRLSLAETEIQEINEAYGLGNVHRIIQNDAETRDSNVENEVMGMFASIIGDYK